jgi:hypothetical protein
MYWRAAGARRAPPLVSSELESHPEHGAGLSELRPGYGYGLGLGLCSVWDLWPARPAGATQLAHEMGHSPVQPPGWLGLFGRPTDARASQVAWEPWDALPLLPPKP